MELSPGTELVWVLACRETQAAKGREVEPDHFFCALLKLADMEDSELKAVATLSLAAEKLVEQRNQLRWHLRLRALDTRTTEVRRAMRCALAQGEDDKASGTPHRSEAACQMFERASALARKVNERLAPQHLLYALLENPTPAMLRALEPPSSPAPPEAKDDFQI